MSNTVDVGEAMNSVEGLHIICIGRGNLVTACPVPCCLTINYTTRAKILALTYSYGQTSCAQFEAELRVVSHTVGNYTEHIFLLVLSNPHVCKC